MDPDTTSAVPKEPVPKFIRYVVTALLFPAFPPVVAKMLGYDFLPSQAWLDQAWAPALAGGALCGGLLLWVMAHFRDRLEGSDFKKGSIILFTSLWGFIFGFILVDITPPMLLAAVNGQKTELTLTVSRADGTGSIRCRHPVEFESLPPVFDVVCGMPDSFRETLSPGDQVVVVGRGTRYGLFAEGMRRSN